MEHIAIDLGGRESQICVRASDGTVVKEERRSTRSLRAFLKKQSPSRVVLETCAEAFTVADAALEAGHQVRVVPSTLVRALGVGARRTKTDRRDAQVLSEVSCRIDLPSVHIPSEQARRRKAMCAMREALVRSRTLLINTVRGWLRTEGMHLGTGGVGTFTMRVRRQQESLRATALPTYVERELRMIDELTTEIDQADRDLAEMAKQDPTCRRLMDVPGVGPVTAIRFVSTVDQVDRFSSAHHLESYLGLVPGEDSSSERQRRTGITKAGSATARWALVEAAWAARRCKQRGPLQCWADEVEKRRGRRIATVALARKLAGVMYAMWRDGTSYDATRGATMA
jgi:transposase